MAVWVKRICKIEVKRYTWPIVAGLAFFFILNGVLMVRTSDNFVTSIYRETRDYQKNYDDYARQKEQRKQNLANVLMQRDTGNLRAGHRGIPESRPHVCLRIFIEDHAMA